MFQGASKESFYFFKQGQQLAIQSNAYQFIIEFNLKLSSLETMKCVGSWLYVDTIDKMNKQVIESVFMTKVADLNSIKGDLYCHGNLNDDALSQYNDASKKVDVVSGKEYIDTWNASLKLITVYVLI